MEMKILLQSVDDQLLTFLHFYSEHFVNANLDKLRSDIEEGFRENDLDGNSEEHMEIALVLEKPFRMHFSCKDEESTPQAVEEKHYNK